jgi:GT2 family glycosyltransferase
MLKMSLGYFRSWQKEFDGEAEIIVTDSETIKETREMMAQEFGDIKFIEEIANIGFGKSVNNALREAKGEYIFIANADLVVPRPDELNRMIEYMANNPEVGIMGPALKNFDNTHQSSAFRYYTPMIIVLRRTPLGKTKWGRRKLSEFILNDIENLLQKPQKVDWLMGSALLTKKEHLDKLGFFDERYFMYMEDVDLCRRFWENGLKVIYFPRATMYHFHRAASRSRNIFKSLFNKYTRIHAVSSIKYFRKHGLKKVKHGV